jgi:hypothetical protein
MSTTIWPRVKKLDRVRHAWVPDASHRRPEVNNLRAPAVNLEHIEPIELLDNELLWKGFFRILAIEVAATLQWRPGRRGEPEANILDRASKGVFPCCRITMSELIGDKENKHSAISGRRSGNNC